MKYVEEGVDFSDEIRGREKRGSIDYVSTVIDFLYSIWRFPVAASASPVGGLGFEPHSLQCEVPGFTAPTSSAHDPSRVYAVFPVWIPPVLLALHGGRTRVEAGLGLGAFRYDSCRPKKKLNCFCCHRSYLTRDANLQSRIAAVNVKKGCSH
ncbi:hypothetical protein LXL04_001389 [Taraxacum kok-saghyz]